MADNLRIVGNLGQRSAPDTNIASAAGANGIDQQRGSVDKRYTGVDYFDPIGSQRDGEGGWPSESGAYPPRVSVPLPYRVVNFSYWLVALVAGAAGWIVLFGLFWRPHGQ